MSIRKSTIALAALAMLAGTALTSTSASALRFGGHGFGGGHFGHGPVINHGGRFHFGYRFPAWNRYHFQHRFPVWGGYRYWPRWSGYRFWPRYGYRFHRPIVSGGPVLGGGAAPMMASASAPAAGPTGGCLTKQYAPDGTVVFKDLCTNEEGVGGPQAGQMPQGPAR